MSEASVLTPPFPDENKRRVGWSRLFGAAEGLALSRVAALSARPMVIVARDARRLRILARELEFFSGAEQVEVTEFPDWECLPYDFFSPHQDIISARLKILADVGRRRILLVSVANLMQRLPPPAYVLGHGMTLEVGQKLDIDSFAARLRQAAYYRVSQVTTPGEYAVRGGLIDLFPMGRNRPIRIDLFGDEIESLRQFDPESQLSTRTLERVAFLPAREFPMDDAAIERFRRNFRRLFDGDPTRQTVYTRVSNGDTVAGLEFYLPLFFDETATLFDYVGDDALWVLDRDIDAEAARFHAEVADRFENCRLDPERRVPAPELLYLTPGGLADALAGRPAILLKEGDSRRSWKFAAGTPYEAPVEPRAERPYRRLIELLDASPERILLVVETAGRREALESVLTGHGRTATPVAGWNAFLSDPSIALGITVAGIERGLRVAEPLVGIVTETQLYGERALQQRRRSARSRDPESIIRSLSELQTGDPVVHEVHGVGRYQSLSTLDIDGESGEFLLIEYQGGDRLYVPILSLDLVGRYLGAGVAPLHKLGSDAWEKARRKAREKAYDVAVELLETAALRESRQGRSLKPPLEPYRDFRDRFPFEETPDQAHAIDEVLGDLESPKPMDRLVCGDVGFGKTEVALRAAFVAVHNGLQVAMLAPTTLLAQQHFLHFRDRFVDLPIAVELLSRFRTGKEIARLVESLQNGYPDIVIGTHRLLQSDVRFRDLGLLIIDEEHRFGVRQKERLKKLRSRVDILTLTATPIPRTLNMAMAGLRGISIIATPPPDRLSIKTIVRQHNNALIREAVLREIHRGGQVYFLHNDVRSIERVRGELSALVPEARIEIGHGQMPGLELERVMRDFYRQRFNVLLCTTIIESGLDVPTANTIIIDRADTFGLAQLHQLRGRVGRSHHQAFAYLLIPPRDLLTADARKRLEAIESMDELGVGFALASHDLEIRGAGELLGESQSGAVDQVGFALFADYLNRAVAGLARDGGRGVGAIEPPRRAAEVSLGCAALLPEDFVPDVHVRLVLYKRIAAARDDEALRELRAEVVDRFGSLPEAAQRLFEVTSLSHRAGRLGIRKIALGDGGGAFTFNEQNHVEPQRVIELIRSRPNVFRVVGADSLHVGKTLSSFEERMQFCLDVLAALETDCASFTPGEYM